MASDDIRLTGRPQVQSTANPQPFKVTASPVDLGATIRPAANGNLVGLVQGLSAINPALEQWHQVQETEQRTEATQAAAAQAQRQTDLTKLDPEVPSNISLAWHPLFKQAYHKGIAERVVLGARKDVLDQYEQQKAQPGFDVEKFLAQSRQTNLAGLPDDMAAHVGEGLLAVEAAVRQDNTQLRLKQMDEGREASISAALSNSVVPGKPSEMVAAYRELLPQIRALGKTQKEAASYFFRRMVQLSDAQGGRPEYFEEMLSNKDGAGFTLADANPELQGHILAAKEQAKHQVDKALTDASQSGNAVVLKGLEERLRADPSSIQFQELLGHLGKFGAFKTDNEVAGFWSRVLTAKATQGMDTLRLERARLGQLYLEDPKDQRRIMEALTGSVVDGVGRAIASGDQTGVAALADALVTAHNTAGSTEPSEPIKRMFQFIGTQLPPAAPSPAFMAGVEMYRRLQSAPNLRDAYFDEKTTAVLSSFIDSSKDGADPSQALKSAFAAVSPEAKKRAETIKELPEFQEKLKKASAWVTGGGLWDRLTAAKVSGVENSSLVQFAAKDAVVSYLMRNPNATDEQAQYYAKQWTAKNFAMDYTTGQAIRVPTGLDPRQTQEAVTHYTAKVTNELALKDRGSEWGLLMLPVNIEQGQYRVMTAFNGAPAHVVGEVQISDLIQQHRRDTLWLPDDAAALKSMELALNEGKPIGDLLQGNARTVAKARDLRVAPAFLSRLDAFERDSATQALRAHPKLEPEAVDTVALFGNPKAPTSAPRGTVESAIRSAGRGGGTGLAASLITMGEGLSLTKYQDPNPKAGDNIGVGYNIKANEKTAPEDLRRAGVDPAQVPSVLSGKAALTTEQAERLLLVTVGRYEKQAQEAAEATQAGLWGRLTGPQRAVLTDIAYQTGDVGQFKKAFSALAGGDLAAFKEQTKVLYPDRNGVHKEDTRRTALREAMLAGSDYWFGVLNRHASLPTGGIQRLSTAP
jgi:hypothetical protein